jgi:hypothetical protein
MWWAKHVDMINLWRLQRVSHCVRAVALALILLLMLAVFADFHRAGLIYARASLLPTYLLFLAAAYASCLLAEALSLWLGHEQRFYCARTAVHLAAMLVVAGHMGVFFLAGGAARAGLADSRAALSADVPSAVAGPIQLSLAR